jgi:hypothetical protein
LRPADRQRRRDRPSSSPRRINRGAVGLPAPDGSTKMSETRDVRSNSVLIKGYAARRLYNTTDLTTVSLYDLAQMILSHRRFVVRDAETGADVTREILGRLH